MVDELLAGPRGQHLALQTRSRKQFSDEVTWRDEVATRAAAVGYGPAERQAALDVGRWSSPPARRSTTPARTSASSATASPAPPG